jgi:carbon storage regulator
MKMNELSALPSFCSCIKSSFLAQSVSLEKLSKSAFSSFLHRPPWCHDISHRLLLHDWGLRSTASHCVPLHHPQSRSGKDDPIMLVLSRRLNEKILLPNTDTTVQVVAIRPGVVRLGIDAPPDVIILREELQSAGSERAGAKRTLPRADAGAANLRALLRQVGDQLKAATIGLGLLQLQLDMHELDDAKATIADLRQALQTLHCGVDGELEQAPSKPSVPAAATGENAAADDSDHDLDHEREGQLCCV